MGAVPNFARYEPRLTHPLRKPGEETVIGAGQVLFDERHLLRLRHPATFHHVMDRDAFCSTKVGVVALAGSSEVVKWIDWPSRVGEAN